MKDLMKQWEGTPFPEMIRNLPEVEMPVAGVRAWLLQGPQQQICFFDIEPTAQVPAHAHSAQWGMVIEGEMKLTIGDEEKLYRKGDWYYIPAGVTHAASFLSRVQVLDMFDEPGRYQAK
jgi:quercetin dioxygenase-like cupin family protein